MILPSYTILIYAFSLLFRYVPDVAILPVTLCYIVTKKISLDTKFFAFLIIICISMLFNILVSPKYFNVITYAHLLVILFTTIIFKDTRFDLVKLINFAKLITLVNVVLLFSYFTNFRDDFFSENMGFYRYRGYMPEPAMAAIFIIFNTIIIFLKKENIVWLFINLGLLFFTFSGTAYILGVVLLLANMAKIISIRNFFIFAFLLYISIASFIFLYSDSLIYHRIEGFLSADFDTSTLMRFFAPYELFTDLISNENTFLFGVGDPELYLERNFDKFHYFYLFNDERTYMVNNAYVVLLSLGGISSLFVYLVIMFIYREMKHLSLSVFILVFPFFSGHFVSLYFWAFVFIYIALCAHAKQEELNKS